MQPCAAAGRGPTIQTHSIDEVPQRSQCKPTRVCHPFPPLSVCHAVTLSGLFACSYEEIIYATEQKQV